MYSIAAMDEEDAIYNGDLATIKDIMQRDPTNAFTELEFEEHIMMACMSEGRMDVVRYFYQVRPQVFTDIRRDEVDLDESVEMAVRGVVESNAKDVLDILLRTLFKLYDEEKEMDSSFTSTKEPLVNMVMTVSEEKGKVDLIEHVKTNYTKN